MLYEKKELNCRFSHRRTGASSDGPAGTGHLQLVCTTSLISCFVKLTVRPFSKLFERITARDTSFSCRIADAFCMIREYSHLIGIVIAKWVMNTVLATL